MTKETESEEDFRLLNKWAAEGKAIPIGSPVRVTPLKANKPPKAPLS